METLPNVIINIILEYQGYHTWRNGKYIPRLNIKDTKYDELKRLPIPKFGIRSTYYVEIKKMIDDRLYLYVITTSIYSNKLHWFMDKFIFDDPTVKKSKFRSQETIHYIYGHNEKQHLSRKI
jgi:hypothetical protein